MSTPNFGNRSLRVKETVAQRSEMEATKWPVPDSRSQTRPVASVVPACPQEDNARPSHPQPSPSAPPTPRAADASLPARSLITLLTQVTRETQLPALT